jgi:hypothetical protein
MLPGLISKCDLWIVDGLTPSDREGYQVFELDHRNPSMPVVHFLSIHLIQQGYLLQEG